MQTAQLLVAVIYSFSLSTVWGSFSFPECVDNLDFSVATEKMLNLSQYIGLDKIKLDKHGNGATCFNNQTQRGYTYRSFRSRLPGFSKDHNYCYLAYGFHVPCSREEFECYQEYVMSNIKSANKMNSAQAQTSFRHGYLKREILSILMIIGTHFLTLTG